MSQVAPIPEYTVVDRLLAQRALYFGLEMFGTSERKNQIQIRSALDDVSDSAKNAVDFSKGSKSVAINSLQRERLLDQILVAHDFPRSLLFSPAPEGEHCTKFHLSEQESFVRFNFSLRDSKRRAGLQSNVIAVNHDRRAHRFSFPIAERAA